MKADPRHIIARRLINPKRASDEGWRMVPGAAMCLDDAKAGYDAGTVEMCQGLSACGHYVEQYAIVRKVRAPGPYPRLFARRDVERVA